MECADEDASVLVVVISKSAGHYTTDLHSQLFRVSQRIFAGAL